MDRYARSRALHERARRVMPAGVSSAFRRTQRPVPLAFHEGRGAIVVDADGNRYVDHTLGWGPQILGHSHPAIVEAVQQQVARAQTFGAQHELEADVAERVVAHTGHERVVFCTTGTEAVQLALRLARAATGRPLVLRFAGHYHGWMDSVLVSPDAERGAGASRPISAGQAPGAVGDTLCVPWNDLALVEQAFAAHAGRIAAVITEPLLANGGGIAPRPGFLAGLRALCDRSGVALVFDEVITGFRVALGGAAALLGVKPDLAVYGKALAGGFALSAVAGRADLLDAIAEGRVFQAGTLNGQPIALAAAKATIDELARDGGAALARVAHHGERLQREMRSVFDRHGVRLQVQGPGAVFWTFLASAPLEDHAAVARHDASGWARLAERLLDHGVLVMQSGRWYVSTAHGEPELAAVIDALSRALDEGRPIP